jgi:CO dehydrogenase/acetyl-CoA synthase delta subunit
MSVRLETVTATMSYHTTAIVDGDRDRKRVEVQIPTTYSWRATDGDRILFVGQQAFYTREEAEDDCREVMLDVLDLEVVNVETGP